MTNLVYSPHPLLPTKDRQFHTNVNLTSRNLSQVLQQTIPELIAEDIFVSVNDVQIPAIEWVTTTLNDGDLITVRQRLHGGDGSNIIAIVAMIALTVFTMGAGAISLAGMTGLAAGSTGLMVAQAAVMMAGTFIIQALFPPAMPSLNSGKDESPTYAISGQSNNARPYSPLPLVVGTHKVSPDLGATPYTTQTSEDIFLHQVFNFGFGDLTVTDIKIGQTPIADYQEVETEWNDVNGDLTIFPTNVDTTAGGELAYEDSWVTRTTPVDTTRIEVDVVGTLFQTNDEGKFRANSVTLDAEYRAVGAGSWSKFLDPSGQPVTVQERMARLMITVPNINYALNCMNDDTKPFRKTFERVVPKGQYDVRFRRITPTQTSRKQTSDLQWSQMKSYQVDDANYLGQKRLGVRVRASGQFNGSIQQLSATVSAAIPTWNGSVWTTQASSNPAWIYLYLARGAHDVTGKRLWGAGLADARIDIEGIKEWGLWCATHNLECNFVFDQKMSIAEMLALVARCGRGSPTWAKGILGAVFDKENLPTTQVFGMANIVAESFNVQYITANLADEFVVKFVNEDNDYKLDEVRQKTPGTTNPVNSVEVTIPGVTNAVQAGKEANLLAARQYYGRRRVSFDTDVEGLVCSRGDVISVSHDLTNWAVSGRLVSGTTTALTLDREVTFESAAAHYIGVRYPDGTYVIKQVVNPYTVAPVTTASITLTTALPSAPNSDVTNAVHDYIYSFDPKATPGKKLKIVGLEPTTDGKVRISAIDEYDEYYDAEDGTYTYVNPSSFNPQTASVTNLAVTERYQGVDQPLRITLTWTLVQASGARLRVRRNQGAWNDYGEIRNPEFAFDLYEYGVGDQIDIELTPIAFVINRNTPVATTISYFVKGAPDFTTNIVVPSPTGLELYGLGNGTEFTGKDAKFVWRKVSANREEIGSETLGAETGSLDPFFQDYEVRIYNTGGTLRRTEYVKDESYTYTYEKNAEDGAGDAARSFRIAVYYRTNTNQISNVPASMVVSNPAPEAPSGLSVSSILKNVYVLADRPADLDFLGMRVHLDTSSGFTPSDLNLIHKGPDTSATIDAGLSYDTNYWVKVAFYDGFDEDELNYSPAQSLTPAMLSDADVQVEVNSRQGLLGTDDWVEPTTDPMGAWDMVGGATTNSTVSTTGTGPFSEPTPVMTIKGSGAAPGWYSQWKRFFDVNPNRPYVSFVWVKRRTSDTTGGLYIGWTNAAGYIATLAGSEDTNPYFVSNAGSTLTVDKWYLAVGIIHSKDTTVTTNLAGIWDPDTGTRVLSGTEYKHLNGSVIEQAFRYGFYSTGTSYTTSDGFEFAKPDAFLMDGAEPSIQYLLRRAWGQGALAKLDNITTAQFAAGITPVEIVASLPGSGNFEGRLAFLTTDNKLYRHDGSNWTAGVSTGDLTGTIGADLLAANSVIAGKVAAGAISTDQLAANAVVASKIAVTNAGQAINRNPQMNDLGAWFAGMGSATPLSSYPAIWSLSTAADGPVGTGMMYYNSTSSVVISSEMMPLDPSKTYRVSVWGKQTGTGTNYLTVAFFDSAGANITGGTSGWSSGTYNYFGRINQAFTGSWVKYSQVFGPNGPATIPSGAKFVCIGNLTNYNAAATTAIGLVDFRLEEVIPGELIVDGAITATKINVSQLSAINANMGSLTAGTLSLDTTGWIKSGQTAYNVGNGFWLGKDGATTKFSLGNSAGNNLRWDGTNLNLVGNVQSANYSAGTSGWAINAAGTAEFNDVTVRGDYLSGGTVKYEITPDTDPVYLVWAGTGTKNDANAVFYIKKSGQAYFGGGLSAGTLKNQGTGTSIATNAEIIVGPFGTNGGSKTVSVTYTFDHTHSPEGSLSFIDPPTATFVLQRSISGGAYTTLTSLSVNGSVGYEPGYGWAEPGFYHAHISGSFTFTDTNTSTGNFTYRAYLSARNATTTLPGTTTQRISIVSVEG